MKIQIIKAEERCFSSQSSVKVTTCGNIIETMQMEKVNRRGSSIVNFGDGVYCRMSDFDPTTGEISGEGLKHFRRTDNRAENLNGLAKSMKAVRDLINCNVVDPKKCRWMTFTYAENMTDPKRLCTDRERFWKRVLRWHKKQSIPAPEYISVVEPQGRGAWHLHELWLYPCVAPYLPNEVIRELWSHGFVTVKRLDDVDNVGAYLTAYLCDIPMDEAVDEGLDISAYEVKLVEVPTEDGHKVPKKYVKGARLNRYPAGMNFYRTSRGIKRPTVEWMNSERAKEKISGATLTFSKTIRLTDDGYVNDIHYEYYNRSRSSCQ